MIDFCKDGLLLKKERDPKKLESCVYTGSYKGFFS